MNKCVLVSHKKLMIMVHDTSFEHIVINLNLVLIYKKDPNPVLDPTFEQVCSSKS